MKRKKRAQRSSRINLVFLAMEISQRSRSSVYNVVNGTMRSKPIEAALKLAEDLLEKQRQEVEQLRAHFASEFPPGGRQHGWSEKRSRARQIPNAESGEPR